MVMVTSMFSNFVMAAASQLSQHNTERNGKEHEKTAYSAHRTIYSGQGRKDRISSRLEF